MIGVARLGTVYEMSKRHIVKIEIDEYLNMVVTRTIGKERAQKVFTIENRKVRKIMRLLEKVWGK